VRITLGDEKNFSEFYLSLGRCQGWVRWRSETDPPEDALWGMCLLLIDRADFDGSAAVFLGDSGAGKSTLAAACYAQGCPVLAEEAVVFSRQDGAWHAQPGALLLRLRPGGRPVLTGALGEQVKALPWIDKFQFSLEGDLAWQIAARPVRSIYLLQRQAALETPRIEALGQADGLKLLLGQRYGLVSAAPELGAREFSTFSSLRRQAAVRLLHMPDDLSALPQVVRTVAADLQTLA
jgi:hypothetical protein